MSTIVQLVEVKVLALSPNTNEEPNTRRFSFFHGSKAFQNLQGDETLFPVGWLDEPITSIPRLAKGGYISHEYPVIMMFAEKSGLDWTPDQHQEAIARMRKSSDEFITRCSKDQESFTSVVPKKETEFINLFDVNMTGIFLEVTMVPVNNESNCIS